MTYNVQWDVFKIAVQHGWPDKQPSVLGTWEADRKLRSACRYITEHGAAWNDTPQRLQGWIARIGKIDGEG